MLVISTTCDSKLQFLFGQLLQRRCESLLVRNFSTSSVLLRTTTAMARALFLCAVLLFASAALADGIHMTAFTSKAKSLLTPPCSVKIVVNNLADRRITFDLKEMRKEALPVVAEKRSWTAVGPVKVTPVKNKKLHFFVSVKTGKGTRGSVKTGEMKVIDVAQEFQNNLEGAKLLVLVATENAFAGTLKIELVVGSKRRVVLEFAL